MASKWKIQTYPLAWRRVVRWYPDPGWTHPLHSTVIAGCTVVLRARQRNVTRVHAVLEQSIHGHSSAAFYGYFSVFWAIADQTGYFHSIQCSYFNGYQLFTPAITHTFLFLMGSLWRRLLFFLLSIVWTFPHRLTLYKKSLLSKHHLEIPYEDYCYLLSLLL